MPDAKPKVCPGEPGVVPVFKTEERERMKMNSGYAMAGASRGRERAGGWEQRKGQRRASLAAAPASSSLGCLLRGGSE